MALESFVASDSGNNICIVFASKVVLIDDTEVGLTFSDSIWTAVNGSGRWMRSSGGNRTGRESKLNTYNLLMAGTETGLNYRELRSTFMSQKGVPKILSLEM